MEKLEVITFCMGGPIDGRTIVSAGNRGGVYRVPERMNFYRLGKVPNDQSMLEMRVAQYRQRRVNGHPVRDDQGALLFDFYGWES